VAAVDRARDVYDERRTLLVDALAAHDVEVGGEEGLNIWVPVHDESAAIVRLASQGIGVSAGAPFAILPEPRGFIRVTAGLVRDRHAEIATAIAEAARTGGWGSRAR
jgi:DNA-binding transcriptional MocR family regulator